MLLSIRLKLNKTSILSCKLGLYPLSHNPRKGVLWLKLLFVFFFLGLVLSLVVVAFGLIFVIIVGHRNQISGK